MLTLGIETSCDETAAAVVRDATQLLASVVHSQVPIHARYGGVVPELASRNHVVAMLPVIRQAMEQAGVTLAAVDSVAVTVGPGLVGSLMVGLETAKMLAYLCDVPLLGVNHIEGHLLSPWVDARYADRMAFPYVALIVSGGHTELFHVRGVAHYELLGATRDDAAGEAFDKVAKRLGAPYPGGPWVDRQARLGDPARFLLPAPMIGRGFAFSFSGLKTAAATLIGRLEQGQGPETWIQDVCAALQRAIVRVLVQKAVRAVRHTGAGRLIIAGGVACNSGLREAAQQAAERHGFELVIPSLALCTDNAAMIACTGALHHREAPRRGFAEFGLDAYAHLPLGRVDQPAKTAEAGLS